MRRNLSHALSASQFGALCDATRPTRRTHPTRSTQPLRNIRNSPQMPTLTTSRILSHVPTSSLCNSRDDVCTPTASRRTRTRHARAKRLTCDTCSTGGRPVRNQNPPRQTSCAMSATRRATSLTRRARWHAQLLGQQLQLAGNIDHAPDLFAQRLELDGDVARYRRLARADATTPPAQNTQPSRATSQWA